MYSMVKPVCAAQVEVSEGGIVSLKYDEQDND